MTQSEFVLSASGLSKKFNGGLIAVRDVNLDLRRGARHALIGPNGAGKTTVINLLTGVLQPTSGHVILNNEDITHVSPHQRVKRGLVRTFQINQLFETLTPLETLLMVATQQRGLGTRWWTRLGHDVRIVERCESLLEQLHLTDVVYRRTDELPYGKRRQLEIGIALACEPLVLLLDEPGAGVPIQERDEILSIIAELSSDVSVLLIEHDMDMVFAFSDRITVMVDGAVLLEDSPEEIADSPRVKAVYLGQAEAQPGNGKTMADELRPVYV